ncbi:ATP-binding cassette domain-containing protein, partial [Turicibacter sanguinis]|nr:ATP-binding cassette domain-containing protein [Turicibacter sanguinis]
GQLSGNLKIKGENALKHNLFKRSNYVGTVLQNPDDQFIGLTVGEDIAFKLENLEVPQAEMKSIVNEVSTLVDIKTHLKSAPHELSGGQKQRVTLAGVMVDDIDILLFDEPLANLDPAAGEQTMSLIDEISRKTHKTIVIIEHRLEDVLQACIDRIIVMNEGCIIADMTPNELLASNLLSQIGIREPLYVTALKYANCEILASMNPQSLNQMDLSRCQEALHRWYDQTEIQKERNQEDFLLEFKKVCFGYQSDSLTLKDVSFQIRKGEMLSLVGKNGAGKSTISKLISGFYQPISGTILLNGEDMGTQTIKERADKIGLVMQNPNQMISKTKIFDEVALGLRVRGVSETEVQERVIETLKICGLYP